MTATPSSSAHRRWQRAPQMGPQVVALNRDQIGGAPNNIQKSVNRGYRRISTANVHIADGLPEVRGGIVDLSTFLD